MNRTLLPILLIFSLAFSADATLVAGPEAPLTTAPLDVSGFEQSQGRIATGGTGFFAVWKDGRAEVHGTAIDPNGQRLHDVPLRIATGAATDDAPGIDAGGGGYLVAWTTDLLAGNEAGMRARLVRADGSMTQVLDLGASDFRGRPRVAFNGTNFLVMWLAPELRLRGAVIRFDGTLVRTFDIATAELSYPDIPLVASGNLFYYAIGRIDLGVPGSGEGYGAAVHLVSVDENGNVGTPVVLSPALTPVFNLHADERGGNIAVGWSTSVFNPGLISSVRITGGTPGPVDTFDAGLLRLHDVVAEPSGFLLVYGNETERRSRYAGSVVESTVAVPLAPMTVDDAASNGTRTLLLARATPRAASYDPLEDDVYVQQLDNSPLEPLSLAPRHQTSPGIAAAGDLRLAVWSEHFGAQRRLTLVAARIDAHGQVLDPNGIDLGLQTNLVVTPYVASNGTDWLVVWVDAAKVYGMRIGRDGTRLDATPFVIAEDTWILPSRASVGVSWDGEHYVVVYVRGIFIRGLRSRIYAIRVLADGSVQQPEIPLVDTGAHDQPAVASDPATGQSLVIWNSSVRISAALLSRGGAVAPVALASEFPNRYRPAVAWSSGTFLAASAYSGPFGNEVRWHLVSPAGAVRMPLSNWPALRLTGGGTATIDVEPTADGFLLYTADVSGSGMDRTTELTASRISAEGVLVEGPQTIAETEATINEIPFAAAGSQVVYVRDIGHVVREITRLYTRSVTSAPGRPKRRAVR